ARRAQEERGGELEGATTEARLSFFRDWAVAALQKGQGEDLRAFGVEFDAWYPESRVYDEDLIRQTLDALAERGLTYEDEGATWLRTSDYGDDKDRVLIKKDGSYT